MEPSNPRRRFLQTAALAVPGAALLGCHASREHDEYDLAYASRTPYLNADEASFLNAATERLIPGARDAGIPEFIDGQLSGPYGLAQTWYMRGPWKDGTEEQGYQSKMTPAQLYRAAIGDIQAYCQSTYQKNFEQLPTGTQDDVLTGLEKGDIKLPDVSSKSFFTMLLKNTQEGYLADPIYGGNRDFAGWKLIGFPGPRYNYVNEIEQYGKAYQMPTVGLSGRANNHDGD